MIARPLGLFAAGALAAGGGLLTLGADTPAGPAAPPPVMNGAALFRAKGCASCHTGPDSTSEVGVGPALDDLTVTADDRIPGVALEDYVRRSIVDPQAFVVGGATSAMPSLPVTPDELDALVTYLLGPST